MKFNWYSIRFHPRFDSIDLSKVEEIASELASCHSEGESAKADWIRLLEKCIEQFENPDSEESKFIEAYSNPDGACPTTNWILLTSQLFLDERAEGKWESICESVETARREYDIAEAELPLNLEEAEHEEASYDVRKRVALKQIRSCFPLPEDPDGMILLALVGEALFRDRSIGTMELPKIGDSQFFREIADAMDGDRTLSTAEFLFVNWTTPIFEISAYPLCFWTDAAIAEFMNERAWIGKPDDSVRDVSADTVKSSRKKWGLIKPTSYVNGCKLYPGSNSWAVSYRTRKSPGPRQKGF